MGLVADYLVIAKPLFKLKLGPVTLPERNEVSFTFQLPAGTAMDRGEPIVQYVMEMSSTPGTPAQIGLAIDINGVEIHRKLFLEGQRDVFSQAVVGGGAFNLTGQNTLRFRPVVPGNDPTQTITFSGVVLWFQRDSAAAG